MLPKIHNLTKVASELTTSLAKILLIVFLLVMVFSTGLQVFCRYVIGAALTWPEEVNIFFMAWITFVGSSVALAQDGHMGVSLFVNKLPYYAKHFAMLLAHLVILWFTLILIRYGYNAAIVNISVVSDALQIPMIVPRASLVVGGCMMLIQAVHLIVGDLVALLNVKEGAV